MVSKTVLENGIRVVTETMPGVRATAVGIIIQASPYNDPSGREGLAHLVEHLIFQGTSSRDARQIAQLMDVGGGHMGGFTTRDYTGYIATVLDDYVPYALDLMGDILLNSIFPPESLAREQTAVINEIEASCDSASERVHDLLKCSVWPNHPLGRPIAGWQHTVKNINREDIIYFVHENYTPDRIIVAAAGGLEHEDFVAQVRDALWRMLGNSDKPASNPPEFETAVSVQYAPVSQAYFSLGIPVYPYTHPDRYSLHLLNNLFGGGISSRLFRSLREENGLVYHIGSEYHAYREAGIWIVEGSTTPDHLMPVLALTLMKWWQMVTGDEPILDDELWRSQMQIRGQHLIGSEDSNTRMSRLATQELYFGHHISADEILQHIDAVNGRSLQQTITALQPTLSQMSVAVVGPHAPEHYSQEAVATLLADFS